MLQFGNIDTLACRRDDNGEEECQCHCVKRDCNEKSTVVFDLYYSKFCITHCSRRSGGCN